jgi:large subunit ribosomal protein L17
MRHRKKGRKLNRTRSHRKSMLRNMVTTFFELEQIETTDAKAKEVRSLAERLVTLAKRDGDKLAARRHVLKVVRSKKIVAKLFDEIAPRYTDRPGGYTRIVKVTNRRGDAAPLSILEFVTGPVTFKERKAGHEEDMGQLVLKSATSAGAAQVAVADGEPDAQGGTGSADASAEAEHETGAGAGDAHVESEGEEPVADESESDADSEGEPDEK